MVTMLSEYSIRPFMEEVVGFYMTDSFVMYKVVDNKARTHRRTGKTRDKERRSACLVHKRRKFVDALVDKTMERQYGSSTRSGGFSIEHYCMRQGLWDLNRLVKALDARKNG